MQSLPYPLGPSRINNGVNFALFAPEAKEVKVILTHHNNDDTLLSSRTGDVWHIFIDNLALPVSYQYLIDGKIVIDPFAPSLKSSFLWGEKWSGVSELKESAFDWEGVRAPGLAKHELIIYEMHVRGFTKDEKSGVAHPGTFLGLIEKIPYLVDLGINAVELMPITEFDETEYNKTNPLTKEQLYNYWGYSTISFFAPMNRYGVEDTENELKLLVRELHRAGIEVILDLVYNHTYDKDRSPYNILAPHNYYVRDAEGNYNNDTGCGNTVNAEQQVVQDLVLSSLRRFAHEFHIDGFRFDLASVMKRESDSLIKAITTDPVLKNCKLIAEPWDMARYLVGRFYTHGKRWSEWNDKYRDTIRCFIKGDAGKKGDFASRLSGSEDLYGTWGSPVNSVNFVTVHDGFTLMDLVSYDVKHNEANGEKNRDGSSNNKSWNCGKEGPTENADITALREKQMRNFLLALFISKGIPLLHMGDEYGHSKLGNNNTWCQDNKLSWFDWKLAEERSHNIQTVQNLIRIRKEEPLLGEDHFFSEEDVHWHGYMPNDVKWEENNKFVAFSLQNQLYVAFNASDQTVGVTLPDGEWDFLFHSAMSPPKKEGNKIDMEGFSSVLMKIRF